jgi:hypothetical protein
MLLFVSFLLYFLQETIVYNEEMSLKELFTPKRCQNSFASKKTGYTAHQGGGYSP